MAEEDVIDDEIVETDDDTEDEDEGNEAHDAPTEIEKLALDMGWAPESDWRGDPGKWVDASTYIRTGPEILKRSLERQDGTIAELKQTLGEFRDHYTKVEERSYKRAIEDLKQQQRQAVEEGDTDAFDRTQAAIDALGEDISTPASKPNDNPDNDPNFISFQGRNAWYGEDFEMTAYADQIAPVVGRKYSGAEFYETIGTEIRKKFPDKFGNSRRKRPRSVEPSGAGGGNRRSDERTYANLPAEAKATCDRFIKQGMFLGADRKPLPIDEARAKYVAQYDWD